MKLVCLCLCLFLTILPLQAFAEDDDQLELQERTDQQEKYEDIFHKHSQMKAHINFYYELLIDKYRPDLKEEWIEITREKEAILKKIKEMKKEGKELELPAITEEWKEKHSYYHEQFLEAVERRDDEKLKSLLPALLQLHKKWNEDHRELFKENN